MEINTWGKLRASAAASESRLSSAVHVKSLTSVQEDQGVAVADTEPTEGA